MQEDLSKRVQELLAFAKEREISIGAVQKLNSESGYIETVPLFRDLKVYPKEPAVAPTTGTPTSPEFLPQ